MPSIFNATPHDFPGMIRVQYVSAHFWETGNAATLEQKLAENLAASSVSTHFVVDTEKCRDQRDTKTLLCVFREMRRLYPKSFIAQYDSQLRVASEAAIKDARLKLIARRADPCECEVYAICDAVFFDVYLMGVYRQGGSRYDIDWNTTLAGVPRYATWNDVVRDEESNLMGRPCWPCVHERLHVGHGCGENVFVPTGLLVSPGQPKRRLWTEYVVPFRDRRPERPISWWSGTMRRNPEKAAEGYFLYDRSAVEGHAADLLKTFSVENKGN